MHTKQKTAILLGATGLVGEQLLQKLIDDNNYAHIKLFSRNPSPITHPKITEYLGDLLHLTALSNQFTGDEVFCCIGTTAAKTKDKTLYKAIDIGIPAQAASLAKTNGIGFFAVISAMGANTNSCIFYNRTKGEMEQAILAQELKHTYILRPSLLYGERKEARLGEDIANWLLNKLRPYTPKMWQNYQSVGAHQVASCLLSTAAKTITDIVNNNPAVTYISSGQIQSFD